MYTVYTCYICYVAVAFGVCWAVCYW